MTPLDDAGARVEVTAPRSASASAASAKRWDAAFAAAPFLAIAILLAPYWTSPGQAPTSLRNDIHTWHAPNIALMARGLAEDGELPRWNPQDFGGIPLVTDPQAGVYNPVHWILAGFDSVAAFGGLIVASAMLGALGFLRYARATGCGLPAASVGAIAFVTGGSVLFRLVELGHVVMAPFFLVPWLWTAFEALVKRPTWLTGIATSLGVAWLVVWMHPQLLFYTAALLVAAAWAALRRSEHGRRGLAVLIGVALVSACLSAVHWLPFLAHLGEAARWVPDLRAATADGPPMPSLLERMGNSARHPEARFVFGFVALALAAVGALGAGRPGPRRDLARLHLLAATVIAIGALGLDALAPMDGMLRHPGRLLILLAMPLAALVALGVEMLGRRADARARIVAAVALAALAFEHGAALRPHVRTAPEERIGALPAGLRLPPDLDADARVMEPRREATGRGIPELAKRRHGIESLTGYNPLLPWRFWVYARVMSGGDPFGFDPRHTTVAVQRERPELADLFAITHELIARPRTLAPWLWRRAPKPLPRAYLAPGPIVAPALDGPDAVAEMVTALEELSGMDPRRQVMLHGDVEAALAAAGARPQTSFEAFREVPVTSRRPNRIALSVANRDPAVLVLAEPHAPGWRAWDAGVEIPVHRANALFRAVVLAPGDHEVAFVYAPRAWVVGRAVSAATLAFCVAGAAVVGVRRWRGRSAALGSLRGGSPCAHTPSPPRSFC